jgi:ribonuclease T2
LLSANGEAQAFERNTPGEFDYYALVLGWAPSYCLTEGRLRRDAECNSAKPRAFVLHGLWPQYEKGWPEDCSYRQTTMGADKRHRRDARHHAEQRPHHP